MRLKTLLLLQKYCSCRDEWCYEGWIEETLQNRHELHIVSNPEFLREGSGIYDFSGDRIVIGADNEEAARKLRIYIVNYICKRMLQI